MTHCPSCRGNLRLVVESEIEIDVCDRCDSVWLDPGELNELYEPSACELGDPIVTSHDARDLVCPRCTETDFCDVQFGAAKVSRCNLCGGVHIDVDTLDRLSGVEIATSVAVSNDGEPEKASEPNIVVSTAAETVFSGGLELLITALFHI